MFDLINNSFSHILFKLVSAYFFNSHNTSCGRDGASVFHVYAVAYDCPKFVPIDGDKEDK